MKKCIFSNQTACQASREKTRPSLRWGSDTCKSPFTQSTPLFFESERGCGGKGKLSFPVKRKFSLSTAYTFTLIELLVVIAIIAILAAILLPALNSARSRGHVANCISNLKQLNMMVNVYGDSFDDYIPPAKFSSGGFHRWHYKVNALLKGIAFNDGDNLVLFSDVFRCPAFQEFRLSEKFPIVERHVTYGMNNATGDKNNTADCVFIKRNKVARASERPLLADFYRIKVESESLTNASQTAFSYYSLSGETVTEAPKHYLHQNKANISFVDGHVSGPEELTVGRWPKKLVQFHLYDTW